jgi:LDH2 family malate/lactate/ureidoglycolate dehydrogenase
MIIGLLAGTLNGAAMGKDVIDFNADIASTTNTGQAILAIDISAFATPRHSNQCRRADTDLRQRRAPARRRPIWMPGEQSATKRVAYAPRRHSARGAAGSGARRIRRRNGHRAAAR